MSEVTEEVVLWAERDLLNFRCQFFGSLDRGVDPNRRCNSDGKRRQKREDTVVQRMSSKIRMKRDLVTPKLSKSLYRAQGTRSL